MASQGAGDGRSTSMQESLRQDHGKVIQESMGGQASTSGSSRREVIFTKVLSFFDTTKPYLIIPADVFERYFKRFNKHHEYLFEDPSGKEWKFELDSFDMDDEAFPCGQKYDHALCGEWWGFLSDNKVKENDTVILEMEHEPFERCYIGFIRSSAGKSRENQPCTSEFEESSPEKIIQSRKRRLKRNRSENGDSSEDIPMRREPSDADESSLEDIMMKAECAKLSDSEEDLTLTQAATKAGELSRNDSLCAQEATHAAKSFWEDIPRIQEGREAWEASEKDLSISHEATDCGELSGKDLSIQAIDPGDSFGENVPHEPTKAGGASGEDLSREAPEAQEMSSEEIPLTHEATKAGGSFGRDVPLTHEPMEVEESSGKDSPLIHKALGVGESSGKDIPLTHEAMGCGESSGKDIPLTLQAMGGGESSGKDIPLTHEAMEVGESSGTGCRFTVPEGIEAEKASSQNIAARSDDAEARESFSSDDFSSQDAMELAEALLFLRDSA